MTSHNENKKSISQNLLNKTEKSGSDLTPTSSQVYGAVSQHSRDNEGYCMVFLRKTKYHVLFIESNGRLVCRRNEEDSNVDHEKAPTIKNPDDMLFGLRYAGIRYSMQYSNDTMKKYIYVIISVDNEWAENWADRHDLYIPINPRHTVEIGRNYPNFYLAHRTYIDSDGDKNTYYDEETEKNYDKLDLQLWSYIHLPYETSVSRDIYITYPPYNSILDNRLFLRILYDILIADRQIKGAGINIARWLRNSGHPLQCFFALNTEDSQRPTLTKQEMYIPQIRNFWSPKVEQIRNYYGELIAYYFGFLSHYTKWLLILSIIGLIFFIAQLGKNEIAIPGSEIFILISILWSTFMIEHWYRYENWLLYKWGMMKYSESEVPRPQFKGKLIISPGTGELIETYPSLSVRYMKIIFSMSTVIVCVCAAISAVVGIWILKRDWGEKNLYKSIGVGCINSIQIQIMNRLYVTVAYYLNEFEGHRLQQEWYNHLVIKRIFFFVVNSFNSLFYLAYFQDYSSYDNPKNACLEALRTQLITLFLTSIFIQNFMEIALPKIVSYVKEKLFERQEKKYEQLHNKNESLNIDSAKVGAITLEEEKEDQKPDILEEQHAGAQVALSIPTDNIHMDGTDEDIKNNANNTIIKKLNISNFVIDDIEYQMNLEPSPDVLDNTAEMVIQYGYIMLFAMIFPIMPLLAIINNFFEFRVDLYNLINTQRPVPLSSGGIGVWKPVLSAFSVVAVFTNMSLITFQTNLISDYFDIKNNDNERQIKIIFFFISCFLLLLFMFIVRYMVDDVDSYTRECIERQLLCERHILIGEIKGMAKTVNINHPNKEKNSLFTPSHQSVNKSIPSRQPMNNDNLLQQKQQQQK